LKNALGDHLHDNDYDNDGSESEVEVLGQLGAKQIVEAVLFGWTRLTFPLSDMTTNILWQRLR
jgi:hypothetical protein